MRTESEIKKLSMNFLLDCAFGQHDDLITAAIDKAYVYGFSYIDYIWRRL